VGAGGRGGDELDLSGGLGTEHGDSDERHEDESSKDDSVLEEHLTPAISLPQSHGACSR
jgi:hypothetical protein